MILLYHRVTRLRNDPQLLAVSPTHFAEQLDVLGRALRPVRLGDLVGPAVPDRAVAVTFDDGYADNLHEAEPLLRRAGVPATVFATTGRTDTAEEFFWDELDRLLLQDAPLPHELTLDLGGITRTFTVDGAADPAWDVLRPARPGTREQLYLDLSRAIHRLPVDAREVALDYIRRWAGVDRTGRPSHRMMTSAELQRLDAGGVVVVGGHTVEHPLLSVETPARQRDEIAANRRALTAITGRPPAAFSYPFGGRRDYTAETVAAAAAAGYTVACANVPGRIRADTDPMQLPRFIVRDWDGPRFATELAAWLDRPSHARRGEP